MNSIFHQPHNFFHSSHPFFHNQGYNFPNTRRHNSKKSIAIANAKSPAPMKNRPPAMEIFAVIVMPNPAKTNPIVNIATVTATNAAVSAIIALIGPRIIPNPPGPIKIARIISNAINHLSFFFPSVFIFRIRNISVK